MSDTTHEEQALDALLTALIAHRQTPERRFKRAESLRIVDPSKLTGRPVPTRAETEIRHLLDDPVGAALRQGIRRIGERLHAVAGGTNGMRDVAYRMGRTPTARTGPILCMLESAWDGIGVEGDRWCA